MEIIRYKDEMIDFRNDYEEIIVSIVKNSDVSELSTVEEDLNFYSRQAIKFHQGAIDKIESLEDDLKPISSLLSLTPLPYLDKIFNLLPLYSKVLEKEVKWRIKLIEEVSFKEKTNCTVKNNHRKSWNISLSNVKFLAQIYAATPLWESAKDILGEEVPKRALKNALVRKLSGEEFDRTLIKAFRDLATRNGG